MATPFRSRKIRESAVAFKTGAEKLSVAFPGLHWELRRAGFEMDAVQYLAITLLVTFGITVFLSIFLFLMIFGLGAPIDAYFSTGIIFVVTIFSFFYILMLPKIEVTKKEKEIEKDLDYMLKDMQIQLTAGIPLFGSIENIAEGNYGACSEVCQNIVTEVESGKAMKDVLNEYGITSPSHYLRRTFWQISNAIQTGSNIKNALEAISVELQREKENRIEVYGKELSLWGLIYMMMVIVAPSMGITLILIMSSFLGGAFITDNIFWLILAVLTVIQIMFIYLVRSKRPEI